MHLTKKIEIFVRFSQLFSEFPIGVVGLTHAYRCVGKLRGHSGEALHEQDQLRRIASRGTIFYFHFWCFYRSYLPATARCLQTMARGKQQSVRTVQQVECKVVGSFAVRGRSAKQVRWIRLPYISPLPSFSPRMCIDLMGAQNSLGRAPPVRRTNVSTNPSSQEPRTSFSPTPSQHFSPPRADPWKETTLSPVLNDIASALRELKVLASAL